MFEFQRDNESRVTSRAAPIASNASNAADLFKIESERERERERERKSQIGEREEQQFANANQGCDSRVFLSLPLSLTLGAIKLVNKRS